MWQIFALTGRIYFKLIEMIYEALSCLVDDMNEYFRNRLRINEDKVALSAIVNQDGTVAIQGENKVAVTIVNVEKEITGKSNASPVIGGTIANKSSSMNINLYILFSAYFSSSNYPEALRFLSFVIAYFQYKNVFTSANTAKLDSGIDKLVFEMSTISPEQLNNVWASQGAKYMPSVIYKMRMLTFDESIIKEYRPVVSNVNGSGAI